MLEIRKRRTAMGMTIPQLAAASRVSIRTIFRIEQDPAYETGVLAAQRIARALGVKVDDLIYEADGIAHDQGRGEIDGSRTAVVGGSAGPVSHEGE